MLHPSSTGTVQPHIGRAKALADTISGGGASVDEQLDQASLHDVVSTTLVKQLPCMLASLQHLHLASVFEYDGNPLAVVEELERFQEGLGTFFLEPSFVVALVGKSLLGFGESAAKAAAAIQPGAAVPAISAAEVQLLCSCLRSHLAVSRLSVSRPMDHIVAAVSQASSTPVQSLMSGVQALQAGVLGRGRDKLLAPLQKLTDRVSLLQRETLKAAVETIRSHTVRLTEADLVTRLAAYEEHPEQLWAPSGESDGAAPDLDTIRLGDLRRLPFLLALMQKVPPTAGCEELLGPSSPQVGASWRMPAISLACCSVANGL